MLRILIWQTLPADESIGIIGRSFGAIRPPTISELVQSAEIRRSQDRAWERPLKKLMEGNARELFTVACDDPRQSREIDELTKQFDG